MRRSRRLVSLLVAATVTVALAASVQQPADAASPGWYQANETIACSSATGTHDFYDGPSASARYDSLFRAGATIPASFLNAWTPQGLGAWTNWDGKGHSVRLVTGYNGARSTAALVGLVVNGGATHTATIPKAHAGGVAVVGKWLFVTGATKGGYPTINRFATSTARARLTHGGYLNPVHTATLKVGGTSFKASFLGQYGSTLYVGMFDKDHRNRMYRYTVHGNGSLSLVGSSSSWIQVPKKTQGLAVSGTHYFFSTSYGRNVRGNVYVVRRGHKTLDAAHPQDLSCFRSPSMNEGLAIIGSSLFVLFESGSHEYRSDPKTLNVITGLHFASLASLQRLA